LLSETVGVTRSSPRRAAMKKKTGKAREKVKTVRDLTAQKARSVKGGKVTISDIVITKKVDKSSPVLFQP
jgi:type VI protein secretion system component Hcp